MKKIFSVITICFTCFSMLYAQNKNIDELFNENKNTKGITYIKIGKPMFGLLKNLSTNSTDLKTIKPLLDNIKGLKMMVVDKSVIENKDVNEIFERIKNTINSSEYEELMTMNDAGTNVKILSKNSDKDRLKDLVLNIDEVDNAIIIKLDGNVSMDAISKIIEQNNISAEKEKNTNTTNHRNRK